MPFVLYKSSGTINLNNTKKEKSEFCIGSPPLVSIQSQNSLNIDSQGQTENWLLDKRGS